jgi:hypothetical protein
MASRKGINQEKFLTIVKRQAKPRWWADYAPSILATPQEAPSSSHALILNSDKLGRGVHCLSLGEAAAAILALYHPKLRELHEQKMLAPWPTPHPLAGFPGSRQVGLPPLSGLIDVAERLGYLSLLPRVTVKNPESPHNPLTHVFPYVGDFLLFLAKDDGESYCINWSVKDTDISFKRKFAAPGKKRQKEEPTAILARHEIEETYYQDAGIRTVRLAANNINQGVVANLKQLFLNHRTKISLTESQQSQILDRFRIALDAGIPAHEVIRSACARGAVTPHDCRTVLYQAIWKRELRVDLFQPILINRPLRPERQDVLEVYSDWFREE